MLQFCCTIFFCVQCMLCCVCIHYLHVCSAKSKYVCVRLCLCVDVSVCVYWMRLASDPDGPALGKEREGVREAGIKTNGSNPLKLMTVCLSEWIYLSQMPGKLALKWFWWQTRPGYLRWQTPKMFMFTELEGRVESDGGVRKSEGEREEERKRLYAVWGDNKWGKIR